jgi:integrase
MLPYNPVGAVDPLKVERSIMKALDPAETARLLAHFRGSRMFTPVLLAVMCGLRRGEITALRWASVDLASRQFSIVESTEQTTKGVRLKETKSGRARTVALAALVVDELCKARVALGREAFEDRRPAQRPNACRRPRGWPAASAQQSHVRILSHLG